MIADRIRSIQAVSGGGGGGGSLTPSVWLDATDQSTLFTDAGVTPVTATGDLVYQWSDKSGNNRHATQPNAAYRPAYTTTQSLSFDGSDDHINAPCIRPLNNLSVEAFFYCDTVAGTWRKVAVLPYSATSWSPPYSAYQLGLNNEFAHISFSVSPNYLDNGLNSPAKLFAGLWYHVVGTFDNGYVKLFVNGSLVNQQDKSGFGTSVLYNTGTDLTIGLDAPYFLGEQFAGKIAKIAVYDKTLSDGEVSVLLAPFIYPRFTSLILNMDGTPGSTNFVDDSPNALAVTAVGDAQIASDATFGTVASFDGAGDYLSIASNPAFNFGTGDFTIEAWLYPTATTGNFGIYATSAGGGPVAKFVVFLDSLSPNCHLFGLTNGNNIYTKATSTVAVNQWSHIAFVRSGTTWTWYINGVASGSGTNSTAISFSTEPTYIGYGNQAFFDYFNGLIGPLRITKGVARYTANFTPPTGLFPVS